MDLLIVLIFSFIITWSVGLFPPIFIRFVVLRRPISKGWSIGLAAFFLFFNIMLFNILGSESKTHSALVLVAWASYAILKTKEDKKTSNNERSIYGSCTSCGQQYANSDYRQDAEIWLCSNCRAEIPKI